LNSFRPEKVALLKRVDEDNMVFLFRSESGALSLLWKNPPANINIPKPVSREFIRKNFSCSLDSSHLLFNIISNEIYDKGSEFKMLLSNIYNKYWKDICEEIIDGSIELVDTKDIFKNRSV
tara:strand:- start:1216 stop:1578 length:363 start_codon:yes stop_codon:yes gene_type:complete